jgi:hypothetical protein
VKVQEMGVEVGVYRAGIGPFGKIQCKLMVDNRGINIERGTSTWFFGLVIVVFLIVVVKLNPGTHMIEKMDKKMEFIMENKEEGGKICEPLEKNTTSQLTTCAKLGQMSEKTKILMKGQESIKKQANSRKMKQ